MNLELISNLEELGVRFIGAFDKNIPLATRRGIMRSIANLRTNANKKVRTHYNRLKAGDINKDWLRKRSQVKGNNIEAISKMSATLGVLDKPVDFYKLSLNKTPLKQKGIPVAQRKNIRVEYPKGRVMEVKGGFIAQDNSGHYRVFRRTAKKGSTSSGRASTRMKKQSAPSIHNLFLNDGWRSPLEKLAAENFTKEFLRQLELLTNQAKA